MSSIGLFYGSTTGNTRYAAELIRAEFMQQFGVEVECLDVAEYYIDEMLAFDHLILGMPTWNIGQLQQDWESVIEEFSELDLHGKSVAIYGLGDQAGYPDTFGDALIFLVEQAEAIGARLVGAWPTTGYTFTSSWAVRDGRFVGLMLDEENQAELTKPRIKAWVHQVGLEFGLSLASDTAVQRNRADR